MVVESAWLKLKRTKSDPTAAVAPLQHIGPSFPATQRGSLRKDSSKFCTRPSHSHPSRARQDARVGARRCRRRCGPLVVLVLRVVAPPRLDSERDRSRLAARARGHLPTYLGSPSVLRVGSTLLAAHDRFGPSTNEGTGTAYVLASRRRTRGRRGRRRGRRAPCTGPRSSSGPGTMPST